MKYWYFAPKTIDQRKQLHHKADHHEGHSQPGPPQRLQVGQIESEPYFEEDLPTITSMASMMVITMEEMLITILGALP